MKPTPISPTRRPGCWPRRVEALGQWNLFVGRIALASFMAYVLGQLLDIHVFDRLRRLRAWWVAPTLSTILGNLADTFAFFAIAFWHGPDAFMREHWVDIAWFDYAVKLTISLLFFLPLYGVLLAWLGRVVLSGHDETLPGLPRR